MELSKKIAFAKEANTLIASHISGTWPGFTPVSFILYDDKNQVAVGNNWPKQYSQVEEDIWAAQGLDHDLFANTVTTYHGITAAIWDTRTWPVNPNISEVASSITHEMFHAFQRIFTSPGANEALMPQYPHTIRSVALVIEENKWLQEIVKNPDYGSVRNCLEKIFALRSQREAEVGTDFISYDKGCESYEGTAVYVEVRMKSLIEGVTPFETAASHLPTLMNSSELLKHYRRRCYPAGLILCLASDIMWPNWQAEWQASGKTIYDWMKEKPEFAALETTISPASLEYAEELLAAYKAEKEQKINEFLAQPLTTIEGDVKLAMFDPMNIVCYNDRCLHKHGSLVINGEKQAMTTPFLIEFGGNIFDVKRVYIPAIAD